MFNHGIGLFSLIAVLYTLPNKSRYVLVNIVATSKDIEKRSGNIGNDVLQKSLKLSCAPSVAKSSKFEDPCSDHYKN